MITNTQSEKPPDIDRYKEWLCENFKIEISPQTKRYYESVAVCIRNEFQKTDVWRTLCDQLKEYDAQYKRKRDRGLLQSVSPPEVVIKPFESILSKSHRKNCLYNKNWPDAPASGWILPGNWLSTIDDVIRTVFVVKYLDGVEFLVGHIQELCKNHEQAFEANLEAREEGYYAAHCYVVDSFEIPREDWDTTKVTVKIELQITTQLQEVIRKLLHRYYETRRSMVDGNDAKPWQWDFRSDEFAANYLGHILHYVEGMILDIHARQK